MKKFVNSYYLKYNFKIILFTLIFRYNLDSILKEWEKDNGPLPDDATDIKSENDNDDDVICLSPSPPSSKKDMKNGKMVQITK